MRRGLGGSFLSVGVKSKSASLGKTVSSYIDYVVNAVAWNTPNTKGPVIGS